MSERTLIATSRGVSSAGLEIKPICYCNRNFTVAEVINIITELRKKQDPIFNVFRDENKNKI